MKIFAAASAALLLATSACSDLPTGTPSAPAPQPETGGAATELRCVVSIARGLSCGGNAQGQAGFPSLIVGGQNVYVRLEASPGSYNASDSSYTIDVTLQNLMTQILGTPDEITGTGMRIFFQRPLEVTAGSGPIALDNADSTGVFLSAGQPYFIYPGALAPGSVSDART